MSNRIKIGGRTPGPRVTNVLTGRTIPCIWSDCYRDGNDKINIAVPVEADKAEFPGQLRIYIFCSELHREFYYRQMVGNPHATL